MKAIGYFCSFIVYLFLSACWSGYVLSVLWAWFIVGRFAGAPVLSIPTALGIAMIVRYLTYNHVPDSSTGDQSTTERLVEAGVQSFLQPLMALLFGAIVRMFL